MFKCELIVGRQSVLLNKLQTFGVIFERTLAR